MWHIRYHFHQTNQQFYSFTALQETDEAYDNPSIGISDDEIFEEMCELFNSLEVPVRLIAANMLLELSKQEETREGIISGGCVPNIINRTNDVHCGETVAYILLHLSASPRLADIILEPTLWNFRDLDVSPWRKILYIAAYNSLWTSLGINEKNTQLYDACSSLIDTLLSVLKIETTIEINYSGLDDEENPPQEEIRGAISTSEIKSPAYANDCSLLLEALPKVAVAPTIHTYDDRKNEQSAFAICSEQHAHGLCLLSTLLCSTEVCQKTVRMNGRNLSRLLCATQHNRQSAVLWMGGIGVVHNILAAVSDMREGIDINLIVELSGVAMRFVSTLSQLTIGTREGEVADVDDMLQMADHVLKVVENIATNMSESVVQQQRVYLLQQCCIVRDKLLKNQQYFHSSEFMKEPLPVRGSTEATHQGRTFLSRCTRTESESLEEEPFNQYLENEVSIQESENLVAEPKGLQLNSMVT